MDIYAEIAKLRKEGRKAALATIIQVQGSIPSYESSKILIRDDGSILGTVGGGCVEAEVWSVAQDVMREEKPRRLHFNLNAQPDYDTGLVCGGSLDIFIEPILATPTLYLFGGGHVSLAISKVAHLAGFDIVVADDREAFANKERFPDAVVLSVMCRARTTARPRMPARAGHHAGALHRHDRQQAQGDRIPQSSARRRGRRCAARARPFAGRARYRRADAGGNRRLGCGRIDCSASERHSLDLFSCLQKQST